MKRKRYLAMLWLFVAAVALNFDQPGVTLWFFGMMFVELLDA
jgi:hypothetical protein